MGQIEIMYAAYFATFSVVLGTTLPFIIELINRWGKLEGKTTKSIVSWVVPVAIMYIGWGLGHLFEGFLSDLPAWHPLTFGVWAGLMANVEWKTVPWLKNAVNSLFDWLLDRDKKK